MRPTWAPAEIDPTKPSVARVYDFYLGGSHNFESDRAFGQQALEAMPHLPQILRDNRAFLRRVVQQLCAEGVDQFLDLGSGIPTVGNVHEVAHALNPQAGVVYVDHDPVAVTHGNALLEGNPRAVAIGGDIREPRRVIEDAVATGLLDLQRPVAVLLIAVLHFIADAEGPAGLVEQYVSAIAPGSYLAITHARRDGQAELREAAAVYDTSDSPNAMRLRSQPEVAAFFAPVALVEPGVVLMPLWRPDPTDDGELVAQVPDDYPGFAGVGRRG